MKTSKFLFATAMLLASTATWATCGTGTAMSPVTGRCEIVAQPSSVNSTSGAGATSDATSASNSTGGQAMADASGSGNSTVSTSNDSRYYMLPSMPAGPSLGVSNCVGNRYRSGGIGAIGSNGGGLIYGAKSDPVRVNGCGTTEELAYEMCAPISSIDEKLECVEKAMFAFGRRQAAAMAYSPAVQQPIQLKVENLMMPPAIVTPEPAAPVKVKRKAHKIAKPACPADQVLACVPKP